MSRLLIVIEGPTASGKTALGIALAKALDTVVISSDSRQFYREISIGTAKPSVYEMEGVPHYFIDSHSIHNPVTAAQYEQEALALIQGELAHLPVLILVGGSGMFIDALCIGLDPIPADSALQNQLRVELEKNGLHALCAELLEKDPVFHQQVDRSNAPRVIRALEVIRLTGTPFSEWRQAQPEPRPFLTERFVIDLPREVLYDRINFRTEIMVAAGLGAEVRKMNDFRDLAPLQTVGYREFFDYFDGKTDLSTCIELIKQHTRNYAKRQLTWFRRHPEANWLTGIAPGAFERTVLQVLQDKHGTKLE